MNTSWPIACASLRTEGLNSKANDDWFSSKTAPIDGEEETGCHPDEAEALKAYLNSKTTSAEAAKAITARISSSEKPADHVYRIWALLCDALFELCAHTEALVNLLVAISALPEPSLMTKASEAGELWSGLPRFGHMWADEHKQGHWRSALASSDPTLRSAMAAAHIHKVSVEAQCAVKGVMPLSWGYEAVSDALESGGAVWDFEVPAAAVWVVVAGEKLRKGPEGGKCWALEREGRFWTGEMTESRWVWWKTRFAQIAEVGSRIEKAAEAGRTEVTK